MAEDLQDILGSLSDDQKNELIKALTAEVKPEKAEPKQEAREPEETFTTNIKSSDEKGRVAGVPVNEMPRHNSFTDSGTEHQDEKNTTPDVSHAERKRPAFKRVDQTCTRCNKSYEIHPQFARDFYICDSCLKR
jgi:hypothetical protein